MFITRQLKGLEDTKSAQFNRYFYLLEVGVFLFWVWVGVFSFCLAGHLPAFLSAEYCLGEVLQHLL